MVIMVWAWSEVAPRDIWSRARTIHLTARHARTASVMSCGVENAVTCHPGWRRSLCFREASGPGLIPALLGSLMGLPPGLVRAVKGPMVRVGPLTPPKER